MATPLHLAALSFTKSSGADAGSILDSVAVSRSRELRFPPQNLPVPARVRPRIRWWHCRLQEESPYPPTLAHRHQLRFPTPSRAGFRSASIWWRLHRLPRESLCPPALVPLAALSTTESAGAGFRSASIRWRLHRLPGESVRPPALVPLAALSTTESAGAGASIEGGWNSASVAIPPTPKGVCASAGAGTPAPAALSDTEPSCAGARGKSRVDPRSSTSGSSSSQSKLQRHAL